MEWSPEAEAALKKVPFFVRKKVRSRVEAEAREAGKKSVSLGDVRLTQQRYLARMGDEVKGYQIEACFGPGGCPNRAVAGDRLLERLEKGLEQADLRAFLKKRVRGGLKHHHEFRVAVADCPNACSQPQIRDLGIIGAVEPITTQEPCSLCRACEECCREGAVALDDTREIPMIDYGRCVRCGKCVEACPTGTLAAGRTGYRIQLAGKLGRRPRLAEELAGIYSEDETVRVLERCLDFYKRNSEHGERFADIYRGPAELGLEKAGAADESNKEGHDSPATAQSPGE